MDKRQRRRKRKNAIEDTMNMVKTIVLVVIAVVLVVFVLAFFRKNFGTSQFAEDSKIGGILDIFAKGRETEESTEVSSEAGEDMEVDTELQEGLCSDKEGHILFVKNGQPVRDCWMDIDRALYRFDAAGYGVTGEYREDAYTYTFAKNGKLQSICRSEGYTDPYAGGEYPALVQSKDLKVYLVNDNDAGRDMLGRLRAIKYKIGASHYLGGEGSKQYTLPGTIQIDGEGYVYWLPLVNGPDEMEARLNGTLYRMKPGDEKRQIVADDVEGYRIVTAESGATYIYYFKNGTLGRCGTVNCREDESVIDFTEDMEYCTVIRDNKIYLQTVSGYTVTKEFERFTTGGFTYKIAADGEILAVEPAKEAVLGEYTYAFLTDLAFGRVRNVVTRKNAEDRTEMISGEFEGECRSIFAGEAAGRLFGEYTYMDGAPHIITITPDGDVDMLMDTETGAENIELYAIGKDSVTVKNTFPDGTAQFQEISVNESTPIALGMEPMDITDMKPGSAANNDLEHLGPGYAGTSIGYAPDGSNYSNGPGSLPEPTAEIPDQPVTVGR